MRKGFTLIELLAVIVILAIIALIAVPQITDVIETARVGAAESSTLGYIDSIEKAGVTSIVDGSNDIVAGTYNVSELESKVDYKGEGPSKGTVTINGSSAVTSATLCVNDRKISYADGKAEMVADSCDDMTESPITYTVYEDGAAVYFNPETGLACTAGEAVSTPGTKTGCMKWYTFGDDGENADSIDLILDHATTASVLWHSTASNVTGPSNILTQLASDTSTWAGVATREDSYTVDTSTATYTIDYSTYKARLITADEVAGIVGNSSYDETTTTYDSWYYLDTSNQTQTALSIGASNFDWLYDYTNGCTSYGCSIENASSEGYWTATAVSGSTPNAWTILRYGAVSSRDTNTTGYGLKPVITVLKSDI